MGQESYLHARPENQPLPIVLVIDDEDNIVELLKLGLKYEGF